MQHLQKNYLTRLAYLTMVIIGMNQGMAFAQEEKKAFDEGDKIISIGVSNGINNILSTSINQGYYRPAFTPSVTFDYGLKG
ncbi:MAG: hypothetical protein MUF58_19080, partial [Arcicella sp.]|nr:hypothetical protein [Arcicella sp.]